MKNYFKSVVMVAAAITIAGFTSCNNDDGPASDEERDAILNITLVNPSLSRVSGPAPGTAHAIKDVSLFVLDGNDNVAWKLWVPDATVLTDNTVGIHVTTAATAIYAIANAGTDLTGTYISKSALESANPLVGLGTQYTNRWATGSQDGDEWTFQTPDSNGNGLLEQRVDLALSFIGARITVTVNNNMNGYNGTSTSTVRISDVAVLNARGESRLFPGNGTSLIPSAPSVANKKFIEGLGNPGAPNAFSYFPASTDYTVEGADVNQLNSPYSFTNASTPSISHFYVFENDADELTEYPTIVTLVGSDVNGNSIYFPVHLAPYETWASNTSGYAGGIERGKSYNITINLNGDATVGTGGGTIDPTVNVKNVELMVSIEITDWTAVPLEKNF